MLILDRTKGQAVQSGPLAACSVRPDLVRLETDSSSNPSPDANHVAALITVIE